MTVPKRMPPTPSDILTVRQVVNGWIVHVGATEYEVPDTLVFNNIDDLCDGIKTFYQERNTDETGKPDSSTESSKGTEPTF